MALRTLPDSLRSGLPAAIEVARVQLAPAPMEAIDQAIAMIASLPSKAAGGIDGEMARATYHAGLSDIPADLVRQAALQAIRECKFRPSPAELRAFVAEPMAERRRRLHRLEAAAQFKPAPEPVPLSAEEEAELEALLRRIGVRRGA